MTPLAFTQELVADLIAAYPALPAPPAHAQLGDLVIDCAGLYATVTTVTEFPLSVGSQNCGSIQLVDLSIIAARDCANMSHDDGSTNWPAQDAVSAGMDADAAALWEWAEKMRADSFAPTTPPSVTFLITGGVATTMLAVQLPVP